MVALAGRKDRRGAHRNLGYLDLMADPLGTVRELYRSLGQELSEGAAVSMEEHLAANPKGRFGTHHYDVADFGVSAAALRERFAGYLSRYSVEGNVTAPSA